MAKLVVDWHARGGGSSWVCSGQEHGHEGMRAQGAYGKGWCGAKGMDAIVQMLCCPASCCNVARCNERAQRSVYMQNAQPLVSLCVYGRSTGSLCRKWDRTEPLVCCRCVCCTIFIHSFASSIIWLHVRVAGSTSGEFSQSHRAVEDGFSDGRHREFCNTYSKYQNTYPAIARRQPATAPRCRFLLLCSLCGGRRSF